MSVDVGICMVAPVCPLADAVEEILNRWSAIGFRTTDPLYAMSENEEAVDPRGAWKTTVNKLRGVTFGAHRAGLTISAALEKAGPSTLRATFFISTPALRGLAEEEKSL